MKIAIELPEEIATSFLDWMNDVGHEQFRRFLREEELIDDFIHLSQEVNYNTAAITIETKELHDNAAN